MSYLGNTPDVGFYTIASEKFSGTGACTQFTLSRTISDANTITVIVNGVIQTPIDSYSVTGGIVTFTEAPSLSSNNITVTYLATSVFTQVNPQQLAVGTVSSGAIAPNSITSDKLANNAVNGNNIATPADIFDDAFLFGGM